MAAFEMYDDPGLPIAVADVDQTLTIGSRGAATVHRGAKRVLMYRSVDGVSATRVNFSGTSTAWFITLNCAALSAADAGTVMQFWVSYGNGAEYTFKLSHADGHTYVVFFDPADFAQSWRGRVYSGSHLLHVVGKISD